MEFSIKIGTKELFRFNIYHSLHSFQGWFNLIVGVAALVTAVVTFGKWESLRTVFLLILAGLFLVYQPLQMWLRCMQTAGTPQFAKPLHYQLDEGALHLTAGEQTADYPWESMVRLKKAGSAYYLYLSKTGALIFPKEQLTGEQAFVAFVEKQIQESQHAAGK